MFHTYTPAEERKIRAVIRGLPKEIDSADILEDLKSQGLPALEVHRLFKAKTKEPYDLVQVVLDPTPSGRDIFNIKSVCHISGLKIEPPHKKNSPGQCHKCQLYGHSARNCHARPRCVKCLGDHGTADCSRQKDTATEPPACVLCGQVGHTANYRGCPRAPRVQTRGKPPRASQHAPSVRPHPAPSMAPELRPYGLNAWASPLPRVPTVAPPPALSQHVAEAPQLRQPQPIPVAPQAPSLPLQAPTAALQAPFPQQAPKKVPQPTKAPIASRDPRPNAPKTPVLTPVSQSCDFRADVQLLANLADTINTSEIELVAAKIRANIHNKINLVCIMNEHKALFDALASLNQSH
ncbi:hypothetical protein ABMA28_010041 [Loxostege sticticalis]|uniref:Pre-C2HC domain-containing protein n=1 Tax=Loxostege sticticalis TaxID=481309 RepID=A0ABD0SA89_LOXSC